MHLARIASNKCHVAPSKCFDFFLVKFSFRTGLCYLCLGIMATSLKVMADPSIKRSAMKTKKLGPREVGTRPLHTLDGQCLVCFFDYMQRIPQIPLFDQLDTHKQASMGFKTHPQKALSLKKFFKKG